MNALEKLFFAKRAKQIEQEANQTAAALFTKALQDQSKSFENLLNRALFNYKGKDSTFWNADDQEKYITLDESSPV